MPKDMTISKCLYQIKEINDMLPLLKKTGAKRTEEDLIKKVITNTLPKSLVNDVTMKEGNMLTFIKAARKLLKQIV